MSHRRIIPLIALWAALLLEAAPAAGRYPRVAQDAQGTWIASDGALVQITGELWTFFTAADGLPADRVRAVAPDEREVWAATPRGLGRMDRNSRRWEVFQAPEPLPSSDVYAVAVDERYAWVGTAAGAVRFDKVQRRWERLDDAQGPGARPVLDILSLGQTVWFATEDGALLHDRQRRTWRRLGPEEGLDVGPVDELLLSGDSLWLLGRRGLARYDLRSGALSAFGPHNGLPDPRVTAFAQVEGEVWLGTPAGIVVYSTGSDAITPFLYARGLPPGEVVGIAPASPYVWVITDGGLGQFNTLTRVWEEKREADGLGRSPRRGAALAGAVLALLQADGFQGYQTARDEWQTYALEDIWSGQAPGQRGEQTVRWNLELQLSADGNISRSGGGWSDQWQVVPDLRLGAGTALEGGRSLDGSVRLDLGDATREGVREYDAELRLRGAEDDVVRELVVSDMLRLGDSDTAHDLLDPMWLEGVGVRGALGRQAGQPREPVRFEVEAGLRRGVRAREFFRGSIDYSFQLAHPYVTPRSEVVKVDGLILDRDVDYIITHTTGALTFLNPDRLNALSLVEVTYTWEQIPRKSTESRSILELLPWDDELGSFKRSGNAVYVTDEGGLFAQIDGAAPKYLDRGWVESVFQDYAQGSTKLSLQIHDMGTPEGAREIFDYDRPISYLVLWEETDSIALLDESLPTSYAVKMWMGRYYVELTVEEKSKSAEILVSLFATAVRTKGDLAGTLLQTLRPLVGRLHLGLQPADGFGLGVGWLGAQEIEDAGVSQRTGLQPRGMELLLLEGWSNHELGGGDWGGELASFVQAARSRTPFGPGGEGSALSGDVLYSSPALSLRLDGELHSRDFDALGSRATPLGTFAGDVRADATLSPLRWLTLRLLYDHERSYLAPELDAGGGGTGVNENLLARLQLSRARWPAVWLLAGRSLLSGGGQRDEKLRLAGSFEYDLVAGLGIPWLKKLALKGYYDYSENAVRLAPLQPAAFPTRLGEERWAALGSASGAAENMRFELKLAPTATEDAYARFERKTFVPDPPPLGETAPASAQPPMESWDLVMGAVSRVLPGVVPTFNGKLSYRRQGEAGGADKAELAQANLSGQVELFPGRWIEALGASSLMVGYGFTNAEEAEGLAMSSALRKDQVEGRVTWGKYDDLVRFESRGKWWTVVEGEFQAESERYLEVLNRLTLRPIYTSPLTARLDFGQLEQLNPEADPASPLGRVRTYLPALEWERRWSLDLVTKLRLEAPLRQLDGAWDAVRERTLDYREWSLRPWAEARWRLRDVWRDSLLRLALRGSFQWFEPYDQAAGGDSGAERAWELGGALYLDWESPGAFLLRLGVSYLYHRCLEIDEAFDSGACRSRHAIQPALKAIARF